MSIEDAQPGDIYVDTAGKLWRITDVIQEPTIEAEEVEGYLDDPNKPKLQVHAAAGLAFGQLGSFPAKIVKPKRRAFIGADVWSGWRRIWRREPTATEAQ